MFLRGTNHFVGLCTLGHVFLLSDPWVGVGSEFLGFDDLPRAADMLRKRDKHFRGGF